MIHTDDYDAMARMFGDGELPEDVVEEYEVQRRMTFAFGHSGALGMNLLIPMLRGLGYGKIVDKPQENVDWRRHIGEEVIAQYGDEQVPGRLRGLSENGRLELNLDRYGVVDVPRYSVKLKPTRELDMKQDPWAKVKRGTKVVVKMGDGNHEGKLTSVSARGLRVRVGEETLLCSPENVELAT